MGMTHILTSRIFFFKKQSSSTLFLGTQMHGRQKLSSTTSSACAQSAKKSKFTAIANAPFLLAARASEDPLVCPANKVKRKKCYTRAPCSRNFTSGNRCLIPQSRLQPEMENSNCGFALDPGYPRDGLVLLLLTSEFESVSFILFLEEWSLDFEISQVI